MASTNDSTTSTTKSDGTTTSASGSKQPEVPVVPGISKVPSSQASAS